jgi:hypothetical protein
MCLSSLRAPPSDSGTQSFKRARLLRECYPYREEIGFSLEAVHCGLSMIGVVMTDTDFDECVREVFGDRLKQSSTKRIKTERPEPPKAECADSVLDRLQQTAAVARGSRVSGLDMEATMC